MSDPGEISSSFSDSDAGAQKRVPIKWLGITSLLLTAAVFLQQFGLITTLNRTDRMMNPTMFIRRSFDLWDPFSDMGAVSFSTIGYLFAYDLPFAAGQWLGIPTWIMIRLMVSAVLVVALWGTVRLLDAMKIALPPARLIGGLFYALSPVILARAGWRLHEALAPAMLPWALLPLVLGTQGRSPRRMAALSAGAIAIIGGINASVTLSILILPVLYLLTREPGVLRRRMIAWWIALVPLAILWWIPQLLFLSRYGSDLLRYSEQIQATTSPATLINTLRSSSDWIVDLGQSIQVYSPRSIVLSPSSFTAMTVISGLGVIGLARKDMPERRFLLVGLVLGTMIITSTQDGVLGNPFSGIAIALFDGPFLVFRNVFKFQSIVTLPLVLGATHACHRILQCRLIGVSRNRSLAVSCLVGVAVSTGAAPIWSNSLLAGDGYESIPREWNAIEALLVGDNATRVLVLPGLTEAMYDWGSPRQLPLEWTEGLHWATRSQLPLIEPSGVQYLDAIELAIERGGDANLRRFLMRGGFSHLVVVNDVASKQSNAPNPTQVRAALKASGFASPIEFGTTGGNGSPRPQVEVYRIGNASVADMYAARDITFMWGDVETVLHSQIDDLVGVPFLLAESDSSNTREYPVVVTDGNRRAGYQFGQLRNNRMYTLGDRNDVVNGIPIDEILYRDDPEEFQTTRQLQGIERLDASSVGPGPWSVALGSAAPSNAFDEDASTAWNPARFAFSGPEIWGSQDPWLSVTFNEYLDPGEILITLSTVNEGAPGLVNVEVTTDRGTVHSQLGAIPRAQRIRLPLGPTRSLRISIDREAFDRQGSSTSVLGISELAIPGLSAKPRLRLPTAVVSHSGKSIAPSWLLTRLRPSARNISSLESEGEVARVIQVPNSQDAMIKVWASASRRSDLFNELTSDRSLTVAADSTYLDWPGLSARNLFDRAEETVWISKSSNRNASTETAIEVSWNGVRSIGEFTLEVPSNMAQPTRVLVESREQRRTVRLEKNGRVSFSPFESESIRVTLQYEVAQDGEPFIIGASGIEIPALQDIYFRPILPQDRYQISCSSGPKVSIGDQVLSFQLSTTWGDLFRSKQLELRPCGKGLVTIPKGTVAVDGIRGAFGVSIDKVFLDSESDQVKGSVREFRIISWGTNERTVLMGAGDEGLFVVNENFNEGWRAELNGTPLTSLKIDGWRHGFLVPRGEGGIISLHFGPQTGFQTAVIIGLILLLVLVLFALFRERNGRGSPIGPRHFGKATTLVFGGLAALWCTGLITLFAIPFTVIKKRYPASIPYLAGSLLATAGVLRFVGLQVLTETVWYRVGDPAVAILAGLAFVGLITSVFLDEPPA